MSLDKEYKTKDYHSEGVSEGGALRWKYSIPGKHVTIKTDVANSDILQLLSRTIMTSVSVKMDLEHGRADIFSIYQHLGITAYILIKQRYL